LKVLASKLETDKPSIKIKWNALIFAQRGGGIKLFSLSEKGLQVKRQIMKDASRYPARHFRYLPTPTHFGPHKRSSKIFPQTETPTFLVQIVIWLRL